MRLVDIFPFWFSDWKATIVQSPLIRLFLCFSFSRDCYSKAIWFEHFANYLWTVMKSVRIEDWERFPASLILSSGTTPRREPVLWHLADLCDCKQKERKKMKLPLTLPWTHDLHIVAGRWGTWDSEPWLAMQTAEERKESSNVDSSGWGPFYCRNKGTRERCSFFFFALRHGFMYPRLSLNLLFSQEWPRTSDHLAFNSRVLESLVCVTMPSLCSTGLEFRALCSLSTEFHLQPQRMLLLLGRWGVRKTPQ